MRHAGTQARRWGADHMLGRAEHHPASSPPTITFAWPRFWIGPGGHDAIGLATAGHRPAGMRVGALVAVEPHVGRVQVDRAHVTDPCDAAMESGCPGGPNNPRRPLQPTPARRQLRIPGPPMAMGAVTLVVSRRSRQRRKNPLRRVQWNAKRQEKKTSMKSIQSTSSQGTHQRQAYTHK